MLREYLGFKMDWLKMKRQMFKWLYTWSEWLFSPAKFEDSFNFQMEYENKKGLLKTDFENPVYLFSSFHLKTWSRWFEVTRLFTIFLFIIYFGCWEIESNLLSFTRNVRPAGCQGSTWTRALIFEALEPRVNLIILNVQSQLNDNSSKIFSRYRKIFHGRDRGDGQSRV